MIILKIKEKGHLVDIPNIPPFRTPAEIDISKGDIRTIVGYLKVCDIKDYEIIATNENEREVYKSEDFNPPKKVKKGDGKKLEKRIDKMEKIISSLYEKTSNDSNRNEEQITNQMIEFQKQVLDAIKNINPGSHSGVTQETKEVDLSEYVEPFIPEIDIEGMKIRSQGKHKTMKKDSDTDGAADALSKLLK